MQASQTSILHLLRIQNQQFVIPVYQRTYKWTRIHCGQLYSDILKASNTDSKNHFIGSIVHISDQNVPVTRVKPLTIIDGQQRLTTVSLLLLALKNYLDENPYPSITSDEINQYLVNTNKKEEEYIKLQLTKQDRDIYSSLINKTKIEIEYHCILDNYMYFYDSIKSGQIDIEKLYEGIAKLIIVEVSLEREHDNPQLIFESLNSTGEKLTEADLIRNFLLMDLKSTFQKQIYNQYWFPIEIKLKEDESNKELSAFIRDYLTFKTKKIPKKSAVYTDFKKYFNQYYSREPETIENLMKDLLMFAGYYERILRCNEKDYEINECLRDLDSIDIKIIHPLILPLYYDYEHNLLTKEDFIYLLRLIESYLIRRVICGYPTQGLNKVFVSLIKDIDRGDHVTSFEKILANKKGNHRFPNNDEFKRSFIVKDIYNLSPKNRKYILFKLENNKSKERLHIDADITIEHILPQSPKLSDEWINALGPNWKEIHNTYLHTIGNLTLTGYNKNMSNKFFTKKRDTPGGFRDSVARLNKELKNLDTWNEEEIVKRANKLFEYAQEAWNYPELDLFTSIDDNKAVISLDDDWTSLRPSSFEFLTEKQEVKDFSDLYYKVIKKIYELDINAFLEAINQEELMSKRFHSLNKNEFNNQPRVIGENIYLNTNLNNEQKRKNLITLFGKVSLEEDDLIIYISEQVAPV
ncbi:DUF262 domain-containing protein [Virgibacillus sp. FSP13]